ncbi:MAG: VOC family protein [Dermatophilaceae bacterium]
MQDVLPGLRHRILFIEVEELGGPGPTHFDLRPTDGSRDQAVDRALALGAREVADRRTPEGRGWVVLADPEGNEFCLLRSDEERMIAGDPIGPQPLDA